MSTMGYATTALIHASSQLALFLIVILLWACGKVKNDLDFQKRQKGIITREALKDMSLQVMPWGGFKFNYAFTDSMAFPPPLGVEAEAPQFFSLHLPGVTRTKKRKKERRS